MNRLGHGNGIFWMIAKFHPLAYFTSVDEQEGERERGTEKEGEREIRKGDFIWLRCDGLT